MGCCSGKKRTIKPKGTVNTVKTITYSPVTKSNRVPAGKLVNQCEVCRTRSISPICPVCSSPMPNTSKN